MALEGVPPKNQSDLRDHTSVGDIAGGAARSGGTEDDETSDLSSLVSTDDEETRGDHGVDEGDKLNQRDKGKRRAVEGENTEDEHLSKKRRSGRRGGN